MKTGKYIPLGNYNDVKIGYGTVDYINLKAIYLKLNTWLEPKDNDKFDSTISKTRKRIKDKIYNSRIHYFKPESIVDLDIRTKGIKTNKRSFMNLEITLFVENKFDIKDNTTKKMMKKFIEDIINETLTDKNLFNFNRTKV